MKYGLFIMDSAVHGEALVSAWRFATAALDCGHQIRQVFFYGDAALSLTQPQPSAIRALDGLAALAAQHGFPLLACQAVAERLGISAHPQAAVMVGSLGQWADALFEMDRIMSFSA